MDAHEPASRIPPGQYVREKWPVLHYGSVPRFDPARWDVRVTFEGVAAKTVLNLAGVRPAARFVMVYGEQGYETNLPLSYLQADAALFAHTADGADLTAEHGWPLRLVVPRLYFWKSTTPAPGSGYDFGFSGASSTTAGRPVSLRPLRISSRAFIASSV